MLRRVILPAKHLYTSLKLEARGVENQCEQRKSSGGSEYDMNVLSSQSSKE